MAQVFLTFYDSGTFPVNFNSDPEGLKDAILAAMRATIDGNSVITGQIGGAMPTSNIGAWLNGGAWYYWNGVTYVPTKIKVGNANFTLTFTANPTANRTVTFQDRTGTVALLSDIYSEGKPTIILGVNPATPLTPQVDWSLSNNFYQIIGNNIAPKMVKSQPGQEVWILINNTGAFTVTWEATVLFTGAHVQTAGSDLYVIKNVGGILLAQHYPNYA